MANQLAVSVVIGAALKSSFNTVVNKSVSQFDRVSGSIKSVESRLRKADQPTQNLSRGMKTAAVASRRLAHEETKLGQSVDALRAKYKKLNTELDKQRNSNKQRRNELRGELFDAVALGAVVVAPLRVAASFEQAMDKVGAVSRASESDMAQLTQTARQLGATTEWSASQAASGMQFLAMAGFSTQEMITAMPGVLNLASAGAIELSSASDIASNVLSGFVLQADQMGRVGDVLTNAFTSSNTSLQGLGETMKYVAPVAAKNHIALELAAAMAGKLGDAGIQGSEAGTALRAIVSRLAAPTREAAQALEDLSLETRTANGDLRALPDVFADMQNAMEGMGSAAQTELISTVFGLEATSAAAILLGKASSGELQTYAASLTEVGSASRVAARQNDNAMGAMKRLGSAVESIAISVGSVLLPPLASIADVAAVVIGKVDGLAQAFPAVTAVVGGLTAALIVGKVTAIAGGFAATFLAGSWLSAKHAAIKLGSAVTIANTRLGTFNKTLLVTGARTRALAIGGAISSFGSSLIAFATRAVPVALGGIRALTVAMVTNPIGAVITGIAVAGVLIYKYWQPLKAFFGGIWSGFTEAVKPAVQALQPLMGILSPIGAALGWVAEKVGAVIGWFGDLLAPVNMAGDELEGFATTGEKVGAIIGNAFKIALAPITAVGTAIGWVGEKLGLIDKQKALNIEPVVKPNNVVPFPTESVRKATTIQRAQPRTVDLATLSSQGNAALATVPSSSAAPAQQVVNHNKYEISVQAQPGQDAAVLVDQIMREIKRREKTEKRGGLYDNE
ncbi:Uncharacterised protein [BD1-7 clade bacterium]|uniref:Phage tail tape measure protein domain-containing protein n=1 Tax=BD1-7 clade bacterium TaxID=2029982 RepID=A0A5S9Q3L2_9GAMM|nr:Uncharacterised protein [BD1-7 clade bacterium]